MGKLNRPFHGHDLAEKWGKKKRSNPEVEFFQGIVDMPNYVGAGFDNQSKFLLCFGISVNGLLAKFW
jgi:hypothetical protein